MMLELAIGDSYGMGFEYVPADVVARDNTLLRYKSHQLHGLHAGQYSDDTQSATRGRIYEVSINRKE